MKETLIFLREKNRYSQTEMAKLVGVSRQAYVKYETGEVEPSVQIVRKLSEIYGVEYGDLIDNSYRSCNKTYGLLKIFSPTPSYGPSVAANTSELNVSETSTINLEKLQLLLLELPKKCYEELSGIIKELIEKNTNPKWVNEVFSLMDENPASSENKNWSREDLYER
mgnify:CR=1 FL=1